MWLNLSKNGFNFKKIPEAVGCFYYREDSVSVKGAGVAQNEDREIQNTFRLKAKNQEP